MPDFVSLEVNDGLLLELPTLQLRGLIEHAQHFGKGTHIGMVASGRVVLELEHDIFPLRAGMFFVQPGSCVLAGRGSALVISLTSWQGLWQIGGPLEPTGRLSYIDGCSDTLVVSPPKMGEPCLNHLHIPAYTRQSQHTHPSDRIGIIYRGHGRCVTSARSFSLHPGVAWWIPAGTPHCFHTEGEPLDVFAWHPDSDFGPTDENHPMLNRTFLTHPDLTHSVRIS